MIMLDLMLVKKQCQRINEQLPTIQIKAQFQRCNSNFWDTNIRRRLVINPAPSLALVWLQQLQYYSILPILLKITCNIEEYPFQYSIAYWVILANQYYLI